MRIVTRGSSTANNAKRIGIISDFQIVINAALDNRVFYYRSSTHCKVKPERFECTSCGMTCIQASGC
jgi:hypothetical protein